MNSSIEIIISVILSLYIIVELIRIIFFRRDNLALFTGFISLISIGFGIYLGIKNGIIIEEIQESNAQIFYNFGIANILIGLLFLLISLAKFIIWKIKKAIA